MIANGMRPIHPGEILLEDFLKPIGMSVNALAKGLHVPATRMSDIVRGRRGVTPDTALRLARFFGGGAQSWLNLQQAYDLKLAEKTLMKKITEEIVPLIETAMRANDVRFSLAA
ncbi:HigA family addiction module antitoxin [Polaromonas sp. CG_9.11]|uniref:HigA family addiction module antitoxin n=1 Tax=Polaromonas sp. CG_9.11 TaxID=2787730 RepID=UPI0018CAB027|nr:HigA family addiction module antitoxin [Polaromonas sp. CG_9.11]MBG6078227.1 addiction module HigA family antidote [Polaromonas sp. CG_9.11]